MAMLSPGTSNDEAEATVSLCTQSAADPVNVTS